MKLKAQTVLNISEFESTRALIAELRQKQGLETQFVRPANGITIAEYANDHKCSKFTAREHLKAWVRQGHFRPVPCIIPLESGTPCRVTVYVPVR